MLRASLFGIALGAVLFAGTPKMETSNGSMVPDDEAATLVGGICYTAQSSQGTCGEGCPGTVYSFTPAGACVNKSSLNCSGAGYACSARDVVGTNCFGG